MNTTGKASGKAKATTRRAAVKLPADLGIESARELQQRLSATLDDSAPLILDAHEVTRVHTAALQLLGMFFRDRRAAGYRTQWRRPSAALCDSAGLLGMTNLLELSRESE
ncbi:STAS domain-containing protein [Sinimarinibacterium sp. CAU 1509]|uniref:STAS domain-containing protein n=1 Tax=Sinimarinibacterium sp. CAU 1509 TaxID=2562283 RepID=UPI0010ACC090|nr:STAS domain-containing protein [Sinimarinibacterium sp. CAU 1509]TJY62831.1 STAS domain-containing protein [Sinimarinibacterium sp. CAU 1509]